MITHPSFNHLNDYADRELPEKARARVSGHLAKCTECRSTVMSIRSMSEEANRLSELRAPEGALGRILERYAAGERVILPVADPPARRVTAWGPRRAAAAAAIVLAFGASVFSVDEIGAERSWMEVDVVSLSRGHTLEVNYEGTSQFAGEDYLRVRSRFRVASDEGRSSEGREPIVGELLRGDGRTFGGVLQLPESVVYAVFAVEDPAGETIDLNGGWLWEYLAEGPDGILTEAALIQKQFDLTGRNWEAAYETAVQTTDLYPNSPEAWNRRAAFGQLGLDEHRLDSLEGVYTSAFERMDRMYADAAIPAAWTAWMTLLARRLELDREAYWASRLQAEAPSNKIAVQDRIFDIDDNYGHDRVLQLEQLNRLWGEAGPMRSIAEAGHRIAVALEDPRTILEWAGRRESVEPTARLAIAAELAGMPAPALRQEGIRRLRAQLELMDAQTDATRALYRSGREHTIRREADRRRVMTVLGGALIADGYIEAGLDTLAWVVEVGWDVEAFRAMAEAYFSRGETADAAAMWANVFVDPNTPDEIADSAAARAQALPMGPSDWDDLVLEARGEMHGRTMAEAVGRGLGSEDADVVDANGQSHRLQDLVAGQVTVIILSTRYCEACLEELPGLGSVLGPILRHDDVTAMIITGEEFTETAEMQKSVTDEGLDIPVYYDTERSAQQALNAWDAPGYFVLDRSGRVRFSANSFEEVVRQVEALRATEGA